ncbi:MAG: ABC transporter substrate-binding protein [Deltaproteobacteria bacterium]|nr:ABC transporter substrate-binding protein [Deltaproteobacteria bacterium]
MRRTLLSALSFLCLAVHPAWPQTRPKLNVVYPAISGINAALWTAAEANSFQKYGLDVTLVYIPSAPQVVRVMLSGDSQISLTGGAPVVNANLSGADLLFIGGVANVPAFYLMALPEIKSIEDLKGKTVGVTRFGSSTDFTMRYILQKHGLQPEKDVTFLQIGGMPELAAAISKRLIVAAPFSSPTNLRAKNAGARILIDMAKAGVYFPHTNIVTTRPYIRTHRDVVLNFLRGYSEGIQKMITDKAFAKKVLQKYTRENDGEIIETTYQYALDYVARPPYPTREGIIETLKQSTHPKAKTANPDDFVDLSLVRSLEDNGFFKEIGLQK